MIAVVVQVRAVLVPDQENLRVYEFKRMRCIPSKRHLSSVTDVN
jgi:hypothetical protein